MIKNSNLGSTVQMLYRKPLPSTRTGPLYNAFSYPTKISPEAIGIFIATHTEPGATILDTFAGSGTTGLGAMLCDKPTPWMLHTTQDLGLKPQWGPRSAVLYEVGVLGSFVSRVLCSPPDPVEFERAARQLLAKVEARFHSLWTATDPIGGIGHIRHVIWSDVIHCTHCHSEISFWKAAVRIDPLSLGDEARCPRCRKRFLIEGADRVVESVFDSILGQKIIRKKRVPVRIHGRTGKLTWQRDPLPSDFDSISRANAYRLPQCAPLSPIVWGDLYRSGYHKGITHLHHFYTRRSFLALSALWDATYDFPVNLRDALQFLVLSYNASHSTLMTRVVVKTGQRDFVITGAQSGVLYVSSLPVEKNVFEGIRRKIGACRDAFSVVKDSGSRVTVCNASSTKLSIPTGTIDYVFTDPPFGDYIPYAEINQLNEAWIGKRTNRSDEAIISVAQKKTVDHYQTMMEQVFSEISRTLKRGAKATVVFHSAKASVWQALTSAYSKAGLRVVASSVLDKVQTSFKQVVSSVSVKGDPLLLLEKSHGTSLASTNPSIDILIKTLLQHAESNSDVAEREPTRLYSRFINQCLERGLPVSIDAGEFYRRTREVLR